MSDDIEQKLNKIQETLDRIEARQIVVRQELEEEIKETEEIKEHIPAVGSFAGSDLPHKKE